MKPRVEVKSRRVGGSTYQVPVDVRQDRAQALGMRWLVSYARKRGEKTMLERLAPRLSREEIDLAFDSAEAWAASHPQAMVSALLPAR